MDKLPPYLMSNFLLLVSLPMCSELMSLGRKKIHIIGPKTHVHALHRFRKFFSEFLNHHIVLRFTNRSGNREMSRKTLFILIRRMLFFDMLNALKLPV